MKIIGKSLPWRRQTLCHPDKPYTITISSGGELPRLSPSSCSIPLSLIQRNLVDSRPWQCYDFFKYRNVDRGRIFHEYGDGCIRNKRTHQKGEDAERMSGA